MPKPTRSIDKALELTPEATAFIRGDSYSHSPASKNRFPADGKAPTGKPKRLRRSGHKSKRNPTSNSPASQQPVQSASDSPPHAGILVPVTTRLPVETADALRRACLEQKLRRKSPGTQQQIIEIAVRTWLTHNRYLSK